MSLCFCCCVFLSLVSDSFLHTGVLSLLVCLFLGNLYTILQHCDQEKCLIQFQFFKIYPEKKKNLPRLDLWPKMWHILKNILCALEKKVKYTLFGWNILQISIRYFGHFSCSCWPFVYLFRRNVQKCPNKPIKSTHFLLGCLFWYWAVWAVCLLREGREDFKRRISSLSSSAVPQAM